jgi:ornithine cyclodeaminase/alanine dehydrogenase-like protein (mu-crystallin family)
MIIVNENDISRLTNPVDLTNVILEAMKTYSSGDYIMPDRSHVEMNDDTLLLMPASSGDYFATKLVSLFPENSKHGEPVLHGIVILNSGQTGKPLAIFNGAKLTAMRTAAVGSAGIKFTSPESCTNLGLIGAGVQGYHQILFACRIRPIKRVTVFDMRQTDLDCFVERLRIELPGIEFIAARDSETVCRNSEIIITATNSTSAILPNDRSFLEGKHIVSIGSYKPEMVEVPDLLFSLVDDVYIDVDMALEESGDLIHPIRKGLLHESRIKLLSSIFDGGSINTEGKTTFFKSVGMAMFDLFAAKYLYDKAVETKSCQKVKF